MDIRASPLPRCRRVDAPRGMTGRRDAHSNCHHTCYTQQASRDSIQVYRIGHEDGSDWWGRMGRKRNRTIGRMMAVVEVVEVGDDNS